MPSVQEGFEHKIIKHVENHRQLAFLFIDNSIIIIVEAGIIII
jgi:hypothetical protein